MKSKSLFVLMLLGLCLANYALSEQPEAIPDTEPTHPVAQPATQPKSDSPFMFVDELKPGMTGRGVSAFKNNELQRFDVEILGIMYDTFPDMDMILARLSGPQFKDMGIIAGMSGSPVYIEGRLIGAVAYGWLFAKEPIAGITPIENMLEVLEKTDDKPHPPDTAPTKDFLSQWNKEQGKTPLAQKEMPTVTVNPSQVPGLSGQWQDFPESIQLEPLKTPLIVTGAHPAVMKRLRHYLADTNLMPMAGGGARFINPELADRPIENGSGLAIPLMSGDMNISAIGTVTYREKDKLLAFGHPFMRMGNVDAPMASAYIYATMPSIYHPFKLGASVREVGSIRQDRHPAIGGCFGVEAPSFNFDVTMKLPNHEKKDLQFHYRIWENDLYSPMMAETAVVESIITQEKLFGNAAVDMKYRIIFDGGKVIEKQDFFSTNRIMAFNVSLPLYYDLSGLMNNSFKKVNIENMHMDLNIIDKFKAVGIETAELDRDIYKPGEKVRIKVFFRPFRKPRFSRTIDLELPKDLRDGVYTLHVADGLSRTRMEFSRSPGIGNIISFEGFVDYLRIHYPRNRLYVLLVDKETGIRVREAEMPGLPGSILSITQKASLGAFTQPINLRFIKENIMKTDFEIRGSKIISVKVDKRGRR